MPPSLLQPAVAPGSRQALLTEKPLVASTTFSSPPLIFASPDTPILPNANASAPAHAFVPAHNCSTVPSHWHTESSARAFSPSGSPARRPIPVSPSSLPASLAAAAADCGPPAPGVLERCALSSRAMAPV
eukprot:3174543-Rhodomonas_salina.2